VADVVVNAPNDGLCDNGLFCDGAETCDDLLDCQAGTPPATDDGVACTDDSCDEVADVVVNAANDANCDNALFCDGSETCDPVLDCQAGTAPTIDDGVACTDDSCDEAADTIVNAPNDGLCDNGLFCDGAEVCDPALDCQVGAPPVIDDGLACTADSCDEVGDVVVNAPDDLFCDDGNDCTADSCDLVVGCLNTPIAFCVSTGFQAFNDVVYDASLDGTGTDPNGQSVHYTSANVTNWGIGQVAGDYSGTTYTSGSQFPNTTGLLVDSSSGTSTGVTATFTQNAATTVIWQPQVAPTWTGGYDAALGTDARNTFGGIVDMTGVSYYGAAGWWVDLTLSGLDPAKLYTFATSASRARFNTDGTDYSTRVTIYTLSGADASSNASTAGVTVISPTSVSFSTGNNHAEGYVARWTDIDPGADGSIVIRAEADPLSGNGNSAYSFDVFMLEEIGGEPLCGNQVLETGEQCDDGNTADGDCCSSTCQLDSLGAACEDGDLCTANDTCDGAGTCNTGGPLNCDDGAFCNGLESCDSGTGCLAGTPPATDDGVACTDDSCDEATDTVVNAANDANCDNALFCDGSETCDAVLDCQAGTPPTINDGVGCTIDSCDEVADVVVHLPSQALCDNGQFCDGTEVCDALLDCQAGTPPATGDGVACTDDSCDEATDTIVHTANDANCDNALFCDGSESCDAVLDCQAGTAPAVDDGVACTDDTCDNTPNDANCDNGLFCDGAETCDPALDCQAGTPPVIDDGVFCTVDSCDEAADAVVNAPQDTLCDNGQFCDGAESCDPALDCQAGTPPVVDDGVACTDDSCDEVADVVVNTANAANCDNGLFCDGSETCDAVLDCQAGTPPTSSDGVGCTDDSCDEATDTIVNAANDANCDNALFCDGSETCDALLDCQAGTPPVVDDGVACTDDSCDEATDAIVNAANDANCNNGLFCDGTETCDALLDCQAGTPPVVDDGVACTDDSCDEVADAVVNAPNDGLCANGQFCDGVETCDAVLGCQPGPGDPCAPLTLICDEATDACLGCIDDGDCADGLFCNGVESCAASTCVAGTPPATDDGVACTDDTCDEATDSIVNTASDANCDNGLFCDGTETCDALLDCQAGTPPTADDGVACTDDTCDEATDTIVNTPNDGLCDNGLFCDGFETCDALLDCQAGTPPVIDDGVACTDDSCDEVTDTVLHIGNDDNCVDDGTVCTTEFCHSVRGCRFSFNSFPCDDADACTAGDVCSLGVCQSGGPLDCDDGDECTADSCDQVLGCAHDPIPQCGVPIPSSSMAGRMVLSLLFLAAGANLLMLRRRREES
jgi:hypothetical protein